jgi:hypothetical protein
MKVRLMCWIPGGAAALLALAALAGTSRAGDLIAIASFDGDNGAAPSSSVTLNAQGDIFGTANGGGSGDVGTVWEFVSANAVPEPSSGVLAPIGAAFVAVVVAIKRRRHLPARPVTYPPCH